MVELFSNYIKNIAICIIFSAFITMLLPTNSFKKYVDIVLGFIIIIVVLSPLKNIIFKNNNSLELKIFSNASQLENYSILNQKDIYEDNQRQLILSNYKQQIKQQISELVSQNINLNIDNINIEIDEDFESNNFAKIKKIELYATENINEPTNNEEQIHIKPVEKVNIQENSTDVYKQNSDNRNYETEKKLESLISDFYKLNNDNIYIIVYI